MKVRSPDGDTDFFDIIAGVLQGDTLAPYLFIICLDYVLRTSIDKIRENGLELTKSHLEAVLSDFKEAEGTPQKQMPTPTKPMTLRYRQIHPTKPKHDCIVWNEPLQALASMSTHTKRNICAIIKQVTFPHSTEPLWNWQTNSTT